jgi:hypothetical protein
MTNVTTSYLKMITPVGVKLNNSNINLKHKEPSRISVQNQQGEPKTTVFGFPTVKSPSVLVKVLVKEMLLILI